MMTAQANDHIDCITSHGRALVRAIEALGAIEPTGPIGRVLARLLMAATSAACGQL